MKSIFFLQNTHYGILSLIHISEPTRQAEISYAVFCLKKKNVPALWIGFGRMQGEAAKQQI